MNKHTVKTAFFDTIPVMTGYLFLGFGFGIIMQQNGYGILWAVAMSLFIYAGSMQYVGVGLLTGGVSLLTAALTTLMVNARHLFYGISMVDAYRGAGKKKPYLIFALTDETYSLVSGGRVPEGISRHGYCLLVSVLDQIYWVAVATIGGILGGVLHFNTNGLDFVMTAMFVVIFMEQWIKDRRHVSQWIGLAAGVICLLIFGADHFLIPTMICILCALTALRKPLEVNTK